MNPFQSNIYHGNPHLPRAGLPHIFTQHELDEFKKCKDDPLYFASHYIKIVTVDSGLVTFTPREYQERMIKTYHENRFVINLLPRQSGKCVHLNTIVKIRNQNGLVSDITIGELYEQAKIQSGTKGSIKNPKKLGEIQGENSREGLYPLSDMWISSQRDNIPYRSRAQNFSQRIWENKSFKMLGNDKKHFGKIKRRQESCLSTWRKIESFFKEILQRRHIRENFQEVATIKNRQQFIYNSIDLLVRENQWKRRGSQETSIEETINFQSPEMYREAWGRGRKKDLVCPTGEMAKHSKIKIFGRNSQNEHIERKESRIFSIKGRKKYFRIFEKNISKFATSYGFSRKWKSLCLRLLNGQKDNRISWGFLARKSPNLFGRVDKPQIQTFLKGNLVKGSNKDGTCQEKWLRDPYNMGIRLQEKSGTNTSGMSDLSFQVERKFTDSIPLEGYEIWTNTGWQKVTNVYKTVPYQEWVLKTKNHDLIAADTHILFSNGEQTFLKDLKLGDYIDTENGPEKVIELYPTKEYSQMYDITVDSDDHAFYSNGILSHNTTAVISYLLHYALFSFNVSIAIIANKNSTAKDILSRLKLAYEKLPAFLKQGIVTWNKLDVEFGNGSKIVAASTSASSIRGSVFNIIFLDEFAHVPDGLAEDFFRSTYPTVSSGQTTKVIIVSTPKGLNHFYTMWTKAQQNKNSYVPIEVSWWEMPGRDEKWKEETIRNIGEEAFQQEFCNQFLGSTSTLINGSTLRRLIDGLENPIYKENYLDVHKMPDDKHTYTITVDVSQGLGRDYSAFIVTDVTEIPYQVVAKYHNNNIDPLVYPSVIYNVAKKYNDAHVLVEVNDIGQQVANILHDEFGYENLIKLEMKNRAGQVVTPGFKKRIQLGVKTTVSVKRIGCANLKALVENNKLQLNDEETIMELASFTMQNQTYKADDGKHDDLAMCLVLFAWLTSQKVFKETINLDIRRVLQEENMRIMDYDILPPPVILNGVTDNPYEVDPDGTIWVSAAKKTYPPSSLDFNYYRNA